MVNILTLRPDSILLFFIIVLVIASNIYSILIVYIPIWVHQVVLFISFNTYELILNPLNSQIFFTILILLRSFMLWVCLLFLFFYLLIHFIINLNTTSSVKRKVIFVSFHFFFISFYSVSISCPYKLPLHVEYISFWIHQVLLLIPFYLNLPVLNIVDHNILVILSTHLCLFKSFF